MRVGDGSVRVYVCGCAAWDAVALAREIYSGGVRKRVRWMEEVTTVAW